MKEALFLAESIAKTIRERFIVLDGSLKVISPNKTFYKKLQLTPEQPLGCNIFKFGN